MKAVDYSVARPSLDLLRRLGYVGVLRYLATLPNPKVISQTEFTTLRAAGFPIGFVWEVTTNWATWDGVEADRQLDALAVGDDCPIYWAVDRAVGVANWQLVGQMLDGVNSRRPKGIYGGSGLVGYCMEHGHASFGWITGASSWDPGPAPKANLRQLVGAPIPGIDENFILQDDWGQWPRPEPTPPPILQPEDEMVKMVTCTDSLGRFWTFWLDGTTLQYRVGDASEVLPGAWLGLAVPQARPNGVIDISGFGVDNKPWSLHADGTGWGKPYPLS